MVAAYVLVQTDVGRSAEVAMTLAGLNGVTMAAPVAGPYDVIAKIEADSVDTLGTLVVSKIQAVEGITRTLTCPIVVL
jgi:DNA-binding Lrp family transcriptional regulator